MKQKRIMPLSHRIQRWFWPLINVFIYKPLVVLFAILHHKRGVPYPEWMLTPDDRVSPFGSGTTPSASNEPLARKVYAKFGPIVGDIYWLAWRNAGYGLNYRLKPDWLKDPKLRYVDLEIVDERTPPAGGSIGELSVDFIESRPGPGILWVRCPDGTWLWERTRKFGPFFLITGYRLSGIASGRNEDLARIRRGWRPVPRPVHHPNMDGRPITSIRTVRTL